MANEEKQYISSKAKEYAQTNNLSQAQAQRLLSVAASYYNDKTIHDNTTALSKEQREAGFISTSSPYTKEQLQNAYNYLLETSKGKTFTDAYKEEMKPQAMFTSTKEQYNNPSYTPSISVGLGDSSLETIPLLKVGVGVTKATLEVAPTVIKGSEKAYDGVTLKITEELTKIAPQINNQVIQKNTQDFAQGYFKTTPNPNNKMEIYGNATKHIINNLTRVAE